MSAVLSVSSVALAISSHERSSDLDLFAELRCESESACEANRRESPLDGVNMNRAFPGKPRGSISYRIADFVKRQVFPRVRVVLSTGLHEPVQHLGTALRMEEVARDARGRGADRRLRRIEERKRRRERPEVGNGLEGAQGCHRRSLVGCGQAGQNGDEAIDRPGADDGQARDGRFPAYVVFASEVGDECPGLLSGGSLDDHGE